jgi:acyl-CoA thioesterase-2
MLVDLLARLRVMPLGGDRFHGDEPDWFGPRVFGGILVGQALDAAMQTVDAAMPPHSLHGSFLRPVAALAPVELTVERRRDSRSFSTRRVTLAVDGLPAFDATVSFHVDEPGEGDYELPMPEVPGPEAGRVDDYGGPWIGHELGPSARRVDGSYASTRRVWLRPPAPVPDDPRTTYVLAAFLSDMTGTAFRPLDLEAWGDHTDASIDHAVWFHRAPTFDDWLYFDFEAVVNAGARSTVRGLLFDRAGHLRLSMAQELLIRRLR